MRDLAILALLSIGCIWSLRQAWVGAMMWTLVSLGSPHAYFGYAAAGWPVSMAVAGCTIVGLLVTKERVNPFAHPVMVLYAALTLWMAIGLPLSFAPDLCYEPFERTVKIAVMLVLTVALIDTRKKLEVFIWVNTFSLGFYGIKGGIFTLTSGGSSIVLGPGGFTLENNAFALAEIVVLPFFRYLQLQSQSKWARRALGVCMALVAISALGSQSRGALLGLIAMTGYFWLKSRNKFAWGVGLILAGVFVLAVMPDSYWARMNTINDYEEDSSSQGRINSWWAAFNIANDNITGGGFRTNIPWVYERYAPNPKMLYVEHSIYFQMLGEFGWIGLFLFLSLGAWTWVNSKRMIYLGKSSPDLQWAVNLGAMIQVSMIGFAVTGAFLSMALFDLPYNIMAMATLGLKFALAERANRATATSGAPQNALPPRPLSRTQQARPNEIRRNPNLP
jgi:putative inorganic carbon (HCO3(-)) transporter